jgi:hypothetical protein
VAGPPVPPPSTPGPADDRPDERLELTPEEARERRQNRWLVIAIVIALLAAGGAGYAISEVENTKDENREGNQAVSALRADLEVLREQLDDLEGQVEQAADASTQSRIQDQLGALDKQVKQLERQADESGSDDRLTERLDGLEERVDELEQDSN